MQERVALCMAEQACANPALVGLDEERLEGQAWLSIFNQGQEARDGLSGEPAISKVWVVSCDDVEPINLAASLKEDRPDLRVVLVAEGGGSLLSRANTADIDEVVGADAFVRSYLDEKMRHSEREACGETPRAEAPEKGRRQKGQALDFEGSQQVETVPLMASGARRKGLGLRKGSEPRREEALSAPLRQTRESALVAVSHPRAFLLPIVSGSGGAGKSAVSVLAALMAQRAGYRTVLLDYDLQFGDVALLAGRSECLSIDEAIAHPDQLERELARAGELVVLAPPARLEMAEEVAADIPLLLGELAGRADVVIANTGASWAEQHAVLLERSNAALFLVDQRATSVRACKHALDLCSRCGIAAGPFRFAVNRCAKGAPLTSIDVSSALGGAPVFELREGGREVEECLSAGAPAELISARNEFCVSIGQVLARLLPDGQARLVDAGLQGPDAKAAKKRGKHAGRWRSRGQS